LLYIILQTLIWIIYFFTEKMLLIDIEMSSDNQEILSLNSGSVLDERMYKSKQLLYLTQLGNPVIPAGSTNLQKINFSFKNEGPYFVSFKDAWVQVPITITADRTVTAVGPPVVLGNLFSDDPLLAVKQSLLSLIRSVSVTTTGGVTILDTEDNIHLTSNLRLLLENNPDYLESIAPQIQFSKDHPHAKTMKSYKAEGIELYNDFIGIVSGETKEKIRVALIGKNHTKERKENISKNKTGKYRNIDCYLFNYGCINFDVSNNRYTFQWYEDAIKKSKSFSCNKYGAHQALLLAYEARKSIYPEWRTPEEEVVSDLSNLGDLYVNDHLS